MEKKIRRLTWDDLDYLVQQIASFIDLDSKRRIDMIYGIPRGGLIPAVMLSHRLNIPVVTHLDYDTISNHSILVVDDIIDSGKTMQRFQKLFATASICLKKGIETRPTYWFNCKLATVEENEWIVFPYEFDVNDPISERKCND